MAKIKSYTDLSQSKTLSKILPLESADMYYLSEESLVPKVNYNGMVFFNSEEEKPSTIIPCWSLTALLGVLPNYQLQTQDDGIGILCSCNGNFNIVTADNPVDACVDMIEKLHGLNLL